MRSLLNKLVIVLMGIIAWMTYENWDRITSVSVTSVKDAVANKISALPAGKSNSTVYQWKDENGKVHVSNTRPENIKNVKKAEYDNNLNIVAPTKIPDPQKAPTEEKPPSSNTTNPVNRYSSAIKDAKNVQNLMNQRNSNLQKKLQ